MCPALYLAIETHRRQGDSNESIVRPCAIRRSGLDFFNPQDHGMEAWIVPVNCSVRDLNLLPFVYFSGIVFRKKTHFAYQVIDYPQLDVVWK